MKKEIKKKYKFNKARHFHSLDDIPLHGTTTVLGIIAKPQLITWAVKMAVSNIKENWKPNIRYSAKEIKSILEGGSTKHHRVKTSAGDIGTNVHEAISKWIKKGCPTEMATKVFCGSDEQVTSMFLKFKGWALENKVEFLLTEKNVYSEKHWFGGIVDFTCILNGRRFVGDIKTGSGIYPEHWLQCGAYDMALNEMTGFEAEGYVIVNIKKDATMQIQQTTQTSIYKEAFIYALELFKIMKKIK